MPGNNEYISNILAQISKLQHERRASQESARSLFRYGQQQAYALKDYYTSRLAGNEQSLKAWLERCPVECTDGWDSPRWLEWELGDPREEKIIRVGDMRRENIDVPGYIPFIGQRRTIIICCNNQTAERGLSLLQSLVIRTAFMLPNDSRFRLLDPAALGSSFLMQSYLNNAKIPVEKNGLDVARDLESVIEEINFINSKMINPTNNSFEKVPHKDRVNWRYQFIFAADFPNEYDERAIKLLQKIGNAGQIAGVYLFIHWNQSQKWPQDEVMIDGFKDAYFIDITGSTYRKQLRPDQAPAPTVQERIFELLGRATQPDEKIGWDDTVATIEETQWWKGDTTQFMETPIGLGMGGEKLNIWFGEKDNGEQCHHGVLVGMPGAGKSSLCHVLICGLAMRYSPEDLHLYLVDGKDGVEFNAYRGLPHARVISLRSSAELSRSVLAELVDEKERRNKEYFYPTGTVNLAQYRRDGQKRGKLPRILLLIDEYQILFEDDERESASENLRTLAQLGRNAGIHIFLASQRYAVSNMQHRNDILENIHMRLIMKITDASIQTLEDFGTWGKSLIRNICNKDHMVVVKDKPGDDDSVYRPGSITFLAEEQRTDFLRALEKRTQAISQKHVPKTIVFDGTAQPRLLANPQLQYLLDFATSPSPQEMEDYAHRPRREGGLEDHDWDITESPRVAWLGQEFNVHGHTRIIFRRRSNQNTILVGEANPPRYGMLAAMFAGLSVSGNPRNTKFIVMDFSPTGKPWSQTLQDVCDSFPQEFATYITKDKTLLDGCLDDLLKELQTRQLLSGEKLLDEPSIFFILTEPNLSKNILRQNSSFGGDSPLGGKLRTLLDKGPEQGIHLILSFASIQKIESIFELRGNLNILQYFQHRVGLKMSERDFINFGISRSKSFAKLQKRDARPICALYRDVESDSDVLFKPYCTDNGVGEGERERESITKDIEEIGAVTQMW